MSTTEGVPKKGSQAEVKKGKKKKREYKTTAHGDHYHYSQEDLADFDPEYMTEEEIEQYKHALFHEMKWLGHDFDEALDAMKMNIGMLNDMRKDYKMFRDANRTKERFFVRQKNRVVRRMNKTANLVVRTSRKHPVATTAVVASTAAGGGAYYAKKKMREENERVMDFVESVKANERSQRKALKDAIAEERAEFLKTIEATAFQAGNKAAKAVTDRLSKSEAA